MTRAETQLDAFRTQIDKWSNSLEDEARPSMSLAEWVVFVSGAISVIIGLFMAQFITRTVGGPLNRTTAAMRALASGDFSVEVPASDQTDKIGQMAGGTAEGASHARQVVSVAESTADHSNEVISSTIKAMGAIEHASRQIAQIIGVIDKDCLYKPICLP